MATLFKKANKMEKTNINKLTYTNDIQEILNLCIEIQNLQIATIFFNISGHVSKLQVDIHTPKWITNVNPTYSEDLYLDFDYTDKAKDIISYLNKLKSLNS